MSRQCNRYGNALQSAVSLAGFGYARDAFSPRAVTTIEHTEPGRLGQLGHARRRVR